MFNTTYYANNKLINGHKINLCISKLILLLEKPSSISTAMKLKLKQN